MISILCPTRKRPVELWRMIESARLTAKHADRVEIVCYVDLDDQEQFATCVKAKVKCVVGPRITLTQCWNECLPLASGELLMQGNDDVVFKTKGWDVMVEDEFAGFADKIIMVHGDDMGEANRSAFGPHPIVHRRWVETLGYFIPPYFSSDYGDTWVNELANQLGRRRFLPFVVEHLHFTFGKAPMDNVYEERLARHVKDNVSSIWDKTRTKRIADINKLGALIGYHMPPDSASRPDHRYGFNGRQEAPAAECPHCKSICTWMMAHGRHCNQCGYEW